MTETNKKKTQLDQYQSTFIRNPDEYISYIGKNKIEELKRLSGPLEGKKWANVNSTFVGGGVAEMLKSIIPFAKGLGINANWYTIKGNDEFFSVTKKFHNMLQGVKSPITLEEIFGAYLETIEKNVLNTFIASDLVIVHDPQPAALVMNGVIFGNILWRCHIDTSAPESVVWSFLLPYINQCAGAIFTMPEFIGPGLQIPLYQIMPCIDPITEKNRQYKQDEALEVLGPLFNKHNICPDRPIFAAVSRYDIHKNQSSIIKAFKRLKKEKKFKRAPYLIFLGNTAADDPEGGAMLKKLEIEAGDDPDIKFLVEDNDKAVGALMKIALAFIHISTREGFGLVVAEALWQETPVIGSKVGGIVKQVIDGQTGYIVDPFDIDTIASKMFYFMENQEESKGLGKNGKEHVRRNFLLPEIIRRYLILLRFYSRIDRQDHPEFRLNEISYSEIIHAVRPEHPYLPRAS